MGAHASLVRALPHRRLCRDGGHVLRAPRTIRGSAVYVPGHGHQDPVAGGVRARSRAAGDRPDRAQAAGGRAHRLGAQLFEAGRIAGAVRLHRNGAAQPGARDLVSDPQEDRRHPQHAAVGHPGAVLQRRIRRCLRQHLRVDRRRLRLRCAQDLRRPHPRRAPAPAERRQGRLHRRAGGEDLRRDLEREGGAARHRGSIDRADAAGAERGGGGGDLRHGDRPHLRAPLGRLRFARRDPRHRHPGRQPRVPAGRHRRDPARLSSIRRSSRCASGVTNRSASA